MAAWKKNTATDRHGSLKKNTATDRPGSLKKAQQLTDMTAGCNWSTSYERAYYAFLLNFTTTKVLKLWVYQFSKFTPKYLDIYVCGVYGPLMQWLRLPPGHLWTCYMCGGDSVYVGKWGGGEGSLDPLNIYFMGVCSLCTGAFLYVPLQFAVDF